MNEKNGILNGIESLWDVALRSIGIQLPDEYVMRFCLLLEKVDELGLDKVSMSDVAEIEHDVRQDIKRILEPKEPVLQDLRNTPLDDAIEPSVFAEQEEDARVLFKDALLRNDGDRKKTAQELGVSERTLYRRLKQLGLV